MNNLLYIIDGIQGILGICPCCKELFRLSDAKLIFPKKKLERSEYSEYLIEQYRIDMLNEKIDKAEIRLEREEEKHEEEMCKLKERARKVGRRKAKKQLAKIDPVFSGNGFDPQDVKVIFDPVEYVIFNRLNSDKPVNGIHFISHSPKTKRQENIVKHIKNVIKKGNIEFEIIKVSRNGDLTI